MSQNVTEYLENEWQEYLQQAAPNEQEANREQSMRAAFLAGVYVACKMCGLQLQTMQQGVVGLLGEPYDIIRGIAEGTHTVEDYSAAKKERR